MPLDECYEYSNKLGSITAVSMRKKGVTYEQIGGISSAVFNPGRKVEGLVLPNDGTLDVMYDFTVLMKV